jgi:peroxiredoxin
MLNHRSKLARALAVISIALTSLESQAATDAGLKPGDKVPSFTLKDQDAHPQTLQSLAGPNGLLLLFNRSADWCPFCKSQLIDLETARRHFEASGIHVASITYDSPEVLKVFATRRGIGFHTLSDPDSSIIDAFGIRNHEAIGHEAGVAIPNYYLISPDGTISRRIAETELLDRVTGNYVYELLFGSGTAEPTHTSIVSETQHLKVTLAQSDLSSAPGARTRFTVRLELPKDSHLYAPGAESFGYHPIRLTLEPSDLYQADSTLYPPSTILTFEKLQEKVPVFQTSTAIAQDLHAIRSPKTNAQFREHPDLIVRGALEYQVCTNTTCYAPEKKSVAWTLPISPDDLDTTRVVEGLRRK